MASPPPKRVLTGKTAAAKFAETATSPGKLAAAAAGKWKEKAGLMSPAAVKAKKREGRKATRKAEMKRQLEAEAAASKKAAEKAEAAAKKQLKQQDVQELKMIRAEENHYQVRRLLLFLLLL